MLRDVMRETREFPNFIQGEGDQLAELPQRFQQAFLQGLQLAHKEMAQKFRQTLLKIVKVRYPGAAAGDAGTGRHADAARLDRQNERRAIHRRGGGAAGQRGN